jgi:hypothetical protein
VSKIIPPMAEAWLEAGKDLGLEVIYPYDLESQGRIYEYVALITHFGSAKGTLVLPLEADNEAVRQGRQDGYFVSRLSEDSYGQYDRSVFVDTLNDWGYCGEKSACPPWYTGEAWTPP